MNRQCNSPCISAKLAGLQNASFVDMVTRTFSIRFMMAMAQPGELRPPLAVVRLIETSVKVLACSISAERSTDRLSDSPHFGSSEQSWIFRSLASQRPCHVGAFHPRMSARSPVHLSEDRRADQDSHSLSWSSPAYWLPRLYSALWWLCVSDHRLEVFTIALSFCS